MKNLIFAIILTASVSSSFLNSQSQTGTFLELKSFYQKNRYFKLHAAFQSEKTKLEQWQILYVDALLKSLFNKPEESNRDIDILLNNYSVNLDDTLKHELYKTSLINALNRFDYENSLKTTEFILENFSLLVDSSEKKNYLNTLEIWKAAKDLKHKNTVIKGDSRIIITRDIAGYLNLPLKVNGAEAEFIFDTGANISTISRSYAKKLKLKQLEGEIEAGTSTDKKVIANLAYADSVNIGNISCYNVLFLVVDDEMLSFAGGLYVINGIVGHPVIKEMKELRISGEELFIPSVPVNKELKNFVLEGFTPVVSVVYKKDTLEFAFDSGAKKTALYYSFFEKYRDYIEKKYEPEEITLEGAGGEMIYKGYVLDKVNISVAGLKAELEDVKLVAELFKNRGKSFYGNLGQDFIKQFGTMIINFESMYIEFVK